MVLQIFGEELNICDTIGTDAIFAVMFRMLFMAILWWGVFDVLALRDLDRKGEERHRRFEEESAKRRTLRRRRRGQLAFASSGAYKAVSSSPPSLPSSRHRAVVEDEQREPGGLGGGVFSWNRGTGRVEKRNRGDRAMCPNCRESYPLGVLRCRICRVDLFAND